MPTGARMSRAHAARCAQAVFLAVEILWNVLDFLPEAAALLGELGGVEVLEGLLRQLLTDGYRKQAAHRNPL
jgi:hypothetical protein